jgi:hypothetical protein
MKFSKFNLVTMFGALACCSFSTGRRKLLASAFSLSGGNAVATSKLGRSPAPSAAITTAPSRLYAKARGEGYGPPLNNISEAVGNTPLVKISNRICPEGRTIYAKCEYFNPLSSVKDRLALAIIEAAEKNGTLKPGQTVVEATSGNTGIGKLLVHDNDLLFPSCLFTQTIDSFSYSSASSK